MEQQVLHWITQYGYLAIFVLLMFGIVGLPVPDETLLTFSGFLVYKGNFSLPLVFASALGGSLCGITLSYILGRTFGLTLIHRYGRYMHISEEHVEKAHSWFGRIGHWALTFGYFIPGIRHITAYAAGMSEVEPPQFALFAYGGGCLWVSTFLALGYFLGDSWEAVEKHIEGYMKAAGVAVLILAAVYLLWRVLRKRAKGK